MSFGGDQPGAQARRKREEALRALAEAIPPQAAPARETGAPSSTVPVPPLRPVRGHVWPRWALPLVSAVALLAVVGLAVAHFLPTSAPKTRAIPSLLALDPETYGIACLQDAAWSPDSAKLAILGTQQNCGNTFPEVYAYFPAVVTIVDARTGRQLDQLKPDITVQRDLHLHAPQYITPINGPSDSGDLSQQGVAYQDLIWSPDSKQIAMQFYAAIATKPFAGQPAAGGEENIQGLYISGVNGANARAFAVPQADLTRFANEWNMKTGAPVLLPAPLSTAAQQFNSAQLDPPSLSYSWRAGGSLLGTGALNASTAPARPPLGPVGNPDGSASFTIWQPVVITPYTGDPEHPQTVPALVAQQGFTAWSPDRTYLLAAYYQWRVQPSQQPAPSAAQLQAEGATNMPLLPVRDAAMDKMLSPATPGGSYTSGAFAWRPDGKRLAALAGDLNNTETLYVLDCASGATLTSMTLSGMSNASGNIVSGPGLLWSPDGTRLLATSGSELFIVGPGKLPK